LAFTISISITGDEKDYTAAVQRAQQETAKLTGETEKASAAAQKGEQAMSRHAVSARNLGTAMALVGTNVALVATGFGGVLGPAIGLASNAIIAMTLATGPAGIALGALSVVVGLLAVRVGKAREEMNDLAERELAQLGRDTNLAKFEQTLKIQALQLRANGNIVREVAAEFEALRLKARELGGDEKTLQLIDRMQGLTQSREVRAATQPIKEMIDNQRAQIIEFKEGAEAATLYKLSALESSRAVVALGNEGTRLIGILRGETQEFIDLKRAIDNVNSVNKFLVESEAAENTIREETRRQLDAEFGIKQQLLTLDVEILRAQGKQIEADRLEAAGKAALNQERVKALENANINRVPGEIAVLNKEATLAETRLRQLGVVSVNVGNEITRAVTDISSAAVNGTLKVGDIGKSALAAVGRVAAEFFAQMLQKKLGFENILLTNMQGLPAQMAGAFQSGSAGVSLGGGSTGLTAGGGSFGGGGGFLSSITNLFGGAGNFLGAGALGLGVGSFGGGMGQLFSTIGSLGGSLLGNIGITSLTQLGGGMFSVVTNSLSSIIGDFAGQFLGTMLGDLIGNFALPGLGSIIGLLLSFLMKPAAPFTKIQARVKTPFRFDALTQEFIAATFGAKATESVGISGSTNKQISNAVVAALTDQANLWTDVLNIFPEFVQGRMIPTLALANRTLKAFLREPFKFSPGGSKGIEEELRDFARSTAPRALFASLRGTIGQGLAGLFEEAGFPDLASAALAQFSPVLPGQARAARGRFTDLRTIPGFKLVGKKKQQDEFRQALADLIGLGSGIAQISPTGIAPFVTEEDLALIEGGFARVLATRNSRKFTAAFKGFKEDAGPVLEFLQQAVKQSQDLMGRGIMAAFEAATESIAIRNFQKTVGAGIQQTVFEGLTQAFIASAQFNDLMAPVQQLIRQFIQDAIATGQTPDPAAFRAALLPRIEDISTRAELLAPLIAELQKLGIDIRSMLGGLTGFRAGGITIHIHGNVDSEDTVTDLLRRMGQLLQPVLGPGFQG
jgi:hypothetical protein